MSGRWNRFSDQEKETAEAVFAALSTRDFLLSDSGREGEPKKRIGFSDLCAYVSDPAHTPPPGFCEALEREETLRVNLDYLIERGALCRFELAQVASTGRVDHREERSFSIDLQESHAIAGRTIVVIELRDPSLPAPQAVFARLPSGPCYKQRLPEAQGGRVQLLVESDSAFLSALRDPDAKVTLR